MLAILFFDFNFTYVGYLGKKTIVNDRGRKIVKLPQFDNEDELSEWLDDMEHEISKEILMADIDHRDEVNTAITNIVKI